MSSADFEIPCDSSVFEIKASIFEIVFEYDLVGYSDGLGIFTYQ